MSAHTPGPWTYEGDKDSLGWVVHVAPKRCISVEGRTNVEADANARLIAAAPDLLAACKDFVAGDEARFIPGYRSALAAIAKAEGAK